MADAESQATASGVKEAVVSIGETMQVWYVNTEFFSLSVGTSPSR